MREYLVNADFDLSLRPGRAATANDGRARQADEMAYHLLLLGSNGDSVLVDGRLDEAFLAYLERAGLEQPATTVLPEVRADAELVPFGWNERSATLNREYEKPAEHPSLDVVRRVNGRRFAAALEDELFATREVLGVYTDARDIEASIASRPASEEGWLIKAEHGNAALGNRRIRSRQLAGSDREVVQRLLEEDECLLLERWRQRVLDLSTVFTVADRGEAKDLCVYEVVNTADGAYIGSFFESSPANLAPWRTAVAEVASKVALRLAEEGYFGPVCLDHFVWSDSGEHHLRPLADLNARLQVSAPILRLWRSWGGDRVFYWLLFAARKLRLPTDYLELGTALGDDAFDAGERRGVIVTSPFLVAGRRLRRTGVLLVGTSRAEVEEMDRRLRWRFEK